MEKIKNLKLLVLDNDDVLFNSSPQIQFHVERNWPAFSSTKLKIRERAISIIQHQYDEIERLIEEARKTNSIPNLPNFNIIRNDVIRTESHARADFEEEYYRRPLLEILESLQMVKYYKEMFLEERDATIEADGKLSQEKGKIPYHEFYQKENWFPYTSENVRDLYELFEGRVISLTAHNGIDDMHGREFEAKGAAVREMVPEMKHYGLRFHQTEHIPGIRRPRNSKSNKIMEIYDLDDLHGVVMVDDSMDNCLDVYNHGGTPILVSQNKVNPYGFATVRSTKPESIIRELTKTGYMSDNSEDILQKPKVLKR